MLNVRLAIVGGGLSGLYAASLLERAGLDSYSLIEARDTLGGRILSPSTTASEHTDDEAPTYDIDRFDLGPTWLWPAYQRDLDHLVRKLGLSIFPQHMEGDSLVERGIGAQPIRVRGYQDSLTSMRLAGGMGTLVHALRQTINADRLQLGRTVRLLRISNNLVEIETVDRDHQVTVTMADHVLLAVPPRLAVESIDFAPQLPIATRQQWQATPTWMAPHAKYVATFESPFWRDDGLSGEARSVVGPLGEIHDASMPGGRAALFGFFSLPATVRRTASEGVLRAHCRAQMRRLFGPRAGTPLNDWIKDWAADPLTATAADLDGAAQGHAAAPHFAPLESPWTGRLTGIASEWSRDFPGYVAGAIDAARKGVGMALSFNNDRGGNT